MRPQFYIFSILLFIVAAGNIAANYKNIRRLELITKPLLLPVIACLYITNAAQISPLWVAGLFLSFLGDTLLMFPQMFVFGGIAFGVSHLCYTSHILIHCVDYGDTAFAYAIPVLIVYAVITAVLFTRIRKGLQKQLHIPYFMYLFVNSLTNTAVLMAALSTGKVMYIFCFIGTVLFFYSDCVLFYGMANPPHCRHVQNVLIMATYIVAQYLLTSGMI